MEEPSLRRFFQECLFCLIKFKLRLLLRHLTACAHKLRHNTAALFLFRLVRRRIFELFTELFAAAGGQKLIYENNRISHIVAHICGSLFISPRIVTATRLCVSFVPFSYMSLSILKSFVISCFMPRRMVFII